MANPFHIQPLKKGDTRTMMDTETANQVIELLNKIAAARVIQDPTIPPNQSRVQVSENDAVILVGTKQA